jgi:hypothetical protein
VPVRQCLSMPVIVTDTNAHVRSEGDALDDALTYVPPKEPKAGKIFSRDFDCS